MVYVSITGLTLKGPFAAPRFWWHALRSMAQAQAAPGNILATARSVDGVQHTLSIWQNRAAMRRFMISGAHARAMRAFPAIASGSTYGFDAEAAPGWDEALAAWRAHGKPYALDGAK
ncbi:MAG: hypothetical protein B7Y45_02195 [Sphingomonas sp. 28-66-16]|nr:MAG: hypothetical protein B7Y45_02195 [Sphingomonas sp. 28-66-16]